MRRALPLVFLAGTVWAEPVTAPPPAEALEALDDFAVVNMRCEGREGNIKYSATLKGKRKLGKHWYRVTYERERTKEMAGFFGEAFWGWDAVKANYVFLSVDDWGGRVLLTSPGPVGDTLIWTGEATVKEHALPIRFTYEKRKKRMKMKVEMEVEGQWVAATEDECR